MRRKISNRWRRQRFLFLPRKLRKLWFIQLKNQIKRAAPVLGGKFMTYDLLQGDIGWTDVYFLSPRGQYFYNACLTTTRHEYAEKVWRLAMDQSYVLAPEPDPDWFSRGHRDPKTGYYTVPAREPEYFDALGGKTRFEWVDAQLPSLANEGNVTVREAWKLDKSYGYGIGLEVVLDVPNLDIDNINQFVKLFLRNEDDFSGLKPLSYRFDEIKYWHA